MVIIANGYPTKDDPEYAFIQPLVHMFANHGIECCVIAPQSISRIVFHRKKKRPYRWYDYTDKSKRIPVFQPVYLSLSRVRIGRWCLSSELRDSSVKRCFFKEKLYSDVFYAQFWECGMAAAKISRKTRTPVFVACGESSIPIFDYYSHDAVERLILYLTGVVCVSTKNLLESKRLGLLQNGLKTIVIPNGVNPEMFYRTGRFVARQRLGINTNDFVGIYVGEFCERKGHQRVLNAIKALPHVKMIMIGYGHEIDENNQILFKGSVAHDELNDFYNAADFFILPTVAEGCCNAIIEALACGLPVISSDLPFNDDILNETNSIRIDPRSIKDIQEAIQKVYEDAMLRKKLSNGALMAAKDLTIENRSEKILQFIDDITL